MTCNNVDITAYLNSKKVLVEKALEDNMLAAEGSFSDHLKAMRYSLFAGGKRIRPILCIAAAEAVTNSPKTEEDLLPIACALECIHTYSLIHDDLPAMDNDDLRRGKPTNHILFGEAAAILAGDSLLTWAFDLISNTENSTLSPVKRLAIIQTLSRAAGPLGMVGGQALDIASENNEFPFSTLQTIHQSKTGALITASVRTGAIGGDASDSQLASLVIYGECIGLAFQIVDDVLNVTSTTGQLGKAAGSDASRGKATYPAYFGLEGSREKAREAVGGALLALEDFDARAEPLRALASYITTRSY
jgi:geranylgeranyl diphosphate synthase type II